MFEFIRSAGPWGSFLALLALVNLGLLVWSIVTLFGANGQKPNLVKQLLDSMGQIAKIAIIAGVLGQINGIYLALQAIRAATDISPPIIYDGAMISFTSTILGLSIGLISYICLAILRPLANRQEA